MDELAARRARQAEIQQEETKFATAAGLMDGLLNIGVARAVCAEAMSDEAGRDVEEDLALADRALSRVIYRLTGIDVGGPVTVGPKQRRFQAACEEHRTNG